MGLLACGVESLLANTADMGSVASLFTGSIARGTVVRFVQAKVLRFGFGWLRPLDHDRLQSGSQQAHIGNVGTGYTDRKGPAASLDKQ